MAHSLRAIWPIEFGARKDDDYYRNRERPGRKEAMHIPLMPEPTCGECSHLDRDDERCMLTGANMATCDAACDRIDYREPDTYED